MGTGAKMKEILKVNGYRQARFAEEIDENIGQLNMVLNEKRNASYEMLMKFINRFTDVDLNWLLRDDPNLNNSVNENEIQYRKRTEASKVIDDIDKNIGVLRDLLTQK